MFDRKTPLAMMWPHQAFDHQQPPNEDLGSVGTMRP
jgi:hypothetical protein